MRRVRFYSPSPESRRVAESTDKMLIVCLSGIDCDGVKFYFREEEESPGPLLHRPPNHSHHSG